MLSLYVLKNFFLITLVRHYPWTSIGTTYLYSLNKPDRSTEIRRIGFKSSSYKFIENVHFFKFSSYDDVLRATLESTHVYVENAF